jgi:transcription elongation GreA/GreB family factor
MNKQTVLQQIIDTLRADLDVAQRAAQTAYETATHEENIAENKYDTLGLEASYLAAGQARRVDEIRHSLALYLKLPLHPFNAEKGLQTGDLVELQDDNGTLRHFFLGPDAAGLKIRHESLSIIVITPRAPLGRMLLGKSPGDDVEIVVNNQRQLLEVVQIL